ncbi:DoxX-like family protein [Cognatiyoonia koreensis]|uniref:DoxX-like family protein n=1 Tax=Cognatiyoonia koreensis TaxID=364200 RepID=A0A1I0QVY1_9RHOB|nr:DoxX family membrane protein [Cognatiyoonia koreensis]SEW31635.1 DoxX-like family protein [Cognatiyoonia koreensis]
MQLFILALRIGLTLAFVYFGLRKVLSDPADVAIYEAIGFGQFPRYITGSVELLCAGLLWMPGLQGIGAAGLVGTMIVGTSALTLFAGMPFWHLIGLGIMAATVAWSYRHQFGAFLPT